MSEKCAKEGCKFKKGVNAYCGKHQAQYFLETTTSQGLKVCANYIRGCKVQNTMDYTYSKCEICLKKEREKDKEKRGNKVETEQGKKQCSACLKVSGIEDFQGTRGETSTCISCRESNKRADAKRVKEHVQELARTNAKKPERKAVKKEWKEKNIEKVATYWIDARKRLIENDLEGYLKKNAEQSKKWREANPEKVKIINQTKINSVENQYGVYQTSAMTKRLVFTITKEEFTDLVKYPCYYCGILQEKGFNGIDRLDSSKDYTLDNCVSCCEMCNMMKGSLGPSIFVHRTEHILTHLKLIKGNLYPNEFANVKGCKYKDYKYSALKRSINFNIDETTFYNTVMKTCYLCGKEQNEVHKNGIDRYDNSKGYEKENIRCCCWNCNYIKKNYDYFELLKKLKLIYNYQKKCPILNDGIMQIKSMTPIDKLTNEEKTEKRMIRKKKEHDNLIEKYTNNDTKKEWILDIVRKRTS
jgi:hypothetical protein